MPYDPKAQYRADEYVLRGSEALGKGLAEGIESLGRVFAERLKHKRATEETEKYEQIINQVAGEHMASEKFSPSGFAMALLDRGVPRTKADEAVKFYRQLRWKPDTAVIDGRRYSNPRTTAYIGEEQSGDGKGEYDYADTGLSKIGDSAPVDDLPGWRIVRSGEDSTRLVNGNAGNIGNRYTSMMMDMASRDLTDVETEIALIQQAPTDKRFGSLFNRVSKREKLAELNAKRIGLMRSLDRLGGNSPAVPNAFIPRPVESEVRRKANDGRIAVFDASTKKFLRYEENQPVGLGSVNTDSFFQGLHE